MDGIWRTWKSYKTPRNTVFPIGTPKSWFVNTGNEPGTGNDPGLVQNDPGLVQSIFNYLGITSPQKPAMLIRNAVFYPEFYSNSRIIHEEFWGASFHTPYLAEPYFSPELPIRIRNWKKEKAKEDEEDKKNRREFLNKYGRMLV